MIDPYVAGWRRKHDTCAGWEDVALFAADVGERPEGHGLARTSEDVAACGECIDCRAVGAKCNVVWIEGARARGLAVLCCGEWVSEAEAADRLGMSREGVRKRRRAGTPLDAPRGETGRRRGKGRTPKKNGDTSSAT